MNDVSADPNLIGSRLVRGHAGVRVYEISHSRRRVPRRERVEQPWHKLLYSVTEDGTVAILAIVGRSFPAARAARGRLRDQER